MALAGRPSPGFFAFATLVLCAWPLWAQPPGEFRDLHDALEAKLATFDRSLDARWDGTPYAVSFAAELLTANGNRGRQLLAAQTLTSVRLELDRLHALGLTAVTVAIPFPLLYPRFLAWNGTTNDFQGLVAFFSTVAQEVHARGMKLAVESGVLFPSFYSAGSGLNVEGYYPTLSAVEFVSGRASVISTIVERIGPDIINVGSEPDTEARLSGQAFLRTPAGFAGMVRRFVEQLAAGGLTNVPVVAGSGTWLYGASAYVEELCAIPGLYGSTSTSTRSTWATSIRHSPSPISRIRTASA
jgi:hypothetical protein